MQWEPVDLCLDDLDDLLRLQKKVYHSEAAIYAEFSIPPLTETRGELEKVLATCKVLKVEEAGRLIASVRGYEQKATCYIGRLMVDTTFQNRGLGSLLLSAIEQAFPAAGRFELFTGHRSEKNLYLYRKHGYREFKREPVSERLTLVYLEKPAPGRSGGNNNGEST